MVQPFVEIILIGSQIGNPGHVDGHYAHTARALSGPEETACFLPQFPQIQPQTAAHAPHIAGLHVGIDIVGKIGSTVLCRHLEQQSVVLRVGPVKITGDGIGGDGILEASAVRIPLDHGLDERLVHHVHLPLTVLVFEVHLPAAHDGRQFRQISRHGPVQRNIGKRRLGTPAAGGVYPVDERLNAFFYFSVGEIVHLYKGGQICVKGGKSLGSGPFILHDPQKVHHLIAQHGQMPGGRGSNLAGDAPQPFLDQLLQRPSRAVTRKHGQVMNVNIRIAVGLCNLVIVDLGQPVVGRHRTGIAQDQTAHGIRHRGILLHAPVLHLHIAVDHILVVQDRGLHGPHFLPLLTVQDISLGHFFITGLSQYLFHTVLNIFHIDRAVLHLGLKVRRHPQRQQIHNIIVILHLGGRKRFHNDIIDPAERKIHL